ncbi:MAG TPA: hypothetical protein DCG57_07760 [Candidatus Riflebacteria bacterium]|jgi:type II secretory pathway component HofQ|nr:hypothetical protein [Candidatus Riflebacteria bacterium]
MKKIAMLLIFVCSGLNLLIAEPEKNFIKVGGALELRENSAGIHISTAAPGYTGTNEIAGLDAGSGDNHVSLLFKDFPVREIIRILARMAKFNIVACRSVTGKIEQVNLKDVEWPVALASLADSMGYQTRLHDGIIFVGTAADFELLSAPMTAGPASEDNISMSFKDAALADILKVAIAPRKNASIVIASTVDGNFSISLSNVTEAVAIKAIARASGYDCMYNDGVWLITSPSIISSLRDKELRVPAGQTDDNVSLDFRNVDISAVFSILAQKSNLQFDLAENVQGKVTIKIVDQSPAKVAAVLAWCCGYQITATASGFRVE